MRRQSREILQSFYNHHIYFIKTAYNSYFLIIYKPSSLIISPLRPLACNWELAQHSFVCPSVQFPFTPFHRNKANCSLSAFDKENLIEFPLDFIHYLYIKSNPNPFFYPALPYELLSSCAFIDKTIKENRIKRKIIIRN